MALNRQAKEQIVAEVREAAQNALSTVVVDSQGVTVSQMTGLRKEANELGVSIRLVRNTLTKRAIEGTSLECLSDLMVGTSLLGFSNEHPGAAARIFKKFADTNEHFTIKGAVYEGEFIEASNIDKLAKLPTYEEAIASLMGTMKEAAAGKLVRTLAALRNKLEEAA
ncbi:MAG: 50S ribosomal protein L10 [Psittacicella sp.]